MDGGRESGGGRTLTRQMKFHVNVFIMSASRGQKPQFWANFDISGIPTTPKLSWVRHIVFPLEALKIWGKPGTL